MSLECGIGWQMTGSQARIPAIILGRVSLEIYPNIIMITAIIKFNKADTVHITNKC
jgi:hypothetical protein